MVVADEDQWAPVTRVPISSAAPNGYEGIRAAEEITLFSRMYRFNWYLCNEGGFQDVLASTIIHESMHACGSVGPQKILDRRFELRPGCSAEELENVCAGK